MTGRTLTLSGKQAAQQEPVSLYPTVWGFTPELRTWCEENLTKPFRLYRSEWWRNAERDRPLKIVFGSKRDAALFRLFHSDLEMAVPADVKWKSVVEDH